MKAKVIATLAAMTVLTGCANSPKPEAVTSANGGTLEIYSTAALSDLNNNRIADNKLRVVTPGDNAMGKGLAVLSALTGNVSTSSFDKENYKGSSIDSMVNPTDSYLTPKAKQAIGQWMAENTSGTHYKQPLYIGRATWALIHKDAATVPAYQLKYKVIFYKRPESGSILSAYTVADCTPAPVEAPLADWQNNNYAKVTQQTEKFMDSCLLELKNQLPRLLKN
ncbi:hypothetical protein EGM70_21475 [Enterobacteriaceae bacterium 89]|nr:hypothetical protein [Enterobacteriaceae bacterium 89]